MVGDTEEIRRTFGEAARWVGVHVMDRGEADACLRDAGYPDGVIGTDWDLKLDPDEQPDDALQETPDVTQLADCTLTA
jgi:hypothetical protein